MFGIRLSCGGLFRLPGAFLDVLLRYFCTQVLEFLDS